MPKDKMTQEDVNEAIRLHRLWLKDKATGQRADFVEKDLSGLDLRGVDLNYADLRSADLSDADLRRADFGSANLSFAKLRSADLRNADLSFANLSFTNLRHANLSFTDLRNADLKGADLKGANLVGAIFSADKYISISNTYFCDPFDIGYSPKPIIEKGGFLSNGELIKSVVTSPKGNFVTCKSGNIYLMNETGIQNANLRIV